MAYDLSQQWSFKRVFDSQHHQRQAPPETHKRKVSKRAQTGTTVTLSNIVSQQSTLDAAKYVTELNKILALYLKQYPKVRISYDGTLIDPGQLEDRVTEYMLPPVKTEDGKEYTATRTVIEWTIDIERALYPCSASGFTLRELTPGIQTPGYHFSAYLRSALLEDLDEAGSIDMDDFPDLRNLLDIAKDQLKRHFLQREADKASSVVEKWKEDNVYIPSRARRTTLSRKPSVRCSTLLP